MEVAPELAQEIAELYNQILESIEKDQQYDESLKKSLEAKIAETGNKKLVAEFKKVFKTQKEEKDYEDKCLASKKKVTRKIKETNRDFEVSFSDFGRFLSRLLPPITIKYSKKTTKETVTEEIIEDDDVDSKGKYGKAGGIGWNV